jgi:hypothetical protein
MMVIESLGIICIIQQHTKIKGNMASDLHVMNFTKLQRMLWIL